MSELTRRCLGAVVGLAIGTCAYWLALRWEYDILAVVGLGLALGVAVGARRRSLPWGLLTAVLAAGACGVATFVFRPFAADPSFGYFVAHLGELPRRSLLTFAAVAVLGFYFGLGRTRPARRES